MKSIDKSNVTALINVVRVPTHLHASYDSYTNITIIYNNMLRTSICDGKHCAKTGTLLHAHRGEYNVHVSIYEYAVL